MRLSQQQLRLLIEAEVDKMRKPKGPNSRDDGDDESSLRESLLINDELLMMVKQVANHLDEIWRSNSTGNEHVRKSVINALNLTDKISKVLRQLNLR